MTREHFEFTRETNDAEARIGALVEWSLGGGMVDMEIRKTWIDDVEQPVELTDREMDALAKRCLTHEVEQ